MARRQLRTGDYPERMRARLGKAVEEARIAAGYLTRPEFAEKARVSLRSLTYLEQADRSVGQKVLYPIAQALPGWTVDTPRHILEGGDAPASDPEDELAARRAAELAAVEEEIQERLLTIGRTYGQEAMRLAADRLGRVIQGETERLSRRPSSDVTHRD